MSPDRPRFALHRFVLQFTALLVIGIWGLAVLLGPTHGAAAQDDQPPVNPLQPGGTGEDADGDADGDPAPAATTPAGMRIAYVNIEDAIRHYPRWWKNFQEIRAETEANEKRMKEEERALAELKAELERGEEVPAAKYEDFFRRANLYELSKRKLQAELENEMRDLSKTVYEDFYNKVEEITKDRFDLVLGVNEKEIRTGTQSEFVQKITVRAVVIYNEEHELTMEVINALDWKSIDEGLVTKSEVDQHRKEYGLPELPPKAPNVPN